MAIGHVRYSTCGDPVMRNVQPLFVDLDSGGFALAHNGNLTNALTLREGLIKRGAICQSTTDTEVILHLVARSGSSASSRSSSKPCSRSKAPMPWSASRIRS